MLLLLACIGAPAEQTAERAAEAVSAPAAPVAAPLLVLAASSLTESLSAVGQRWTAAGNPAVNFSFDASSRLAKQISAGAPADLFVSADNEWMDQMQAGGFVRAETRRTLLGNRLVLAVPAGAPPLIRAPADLAGAAVQRLALAGESVPVGRYGRAALRHAGVMDAVEARVINGDNVRIVLGWVASGEADAGIVYATDVRAEPRVQAAFTFPAESHPPIVYPAAVLSGAPEPVAAAGFLAWCQGAEASAVFAAAGFTLAPGP